MASTRTLCPARKNARRTLCSMPTACRSQASRTALPQVASMMPIDLRRRASMSIAYRSASIFHRPRATASIWPLAVDVSNRRPSMQFTTTVATSDNCAQRRCSSALWQLVRVCVCVPCNCSCLRFWNIAQFRFSLALSRLRQKFSSSLAF